MRCRKGTTRSSNPQSRPKKNLRLIDGLIDCFNNRLHRIWAHTSRGEKSRIKKKAKRKATFFFLSSMDKRRKKKKRGKQARKVEAFSCRAFILLRQALPVHCPLLWTLKPPPDAVNYTNISANSPYLGPWLQRVYAGFLLEGEGAAGASLFNAEERWKLVETKSKIGIQPYAPLKSC